MMRLAVLTALLLAAGAMACGDAAVRYEVTVDFNTSAVQDDIDNVAALLRAYDDDLEFVVLERFPPTGRALLATDEPDFCQTIQSQLEAKTYVTKTSCRRR